MKMQLLCVRYFLFYFYYYSSFFMSITNIPVRLNKLIKLIAFVNNWFYMSSFNQLFD